MARIIGQEGITSVFVRIVINTILGLRGPFSAGNVMKIISKVHDYYDSVSSLGVSDTYYLRKPETSTLIDPLGDILSKTNCWGGTPGILFFCNQVIPLISLKNGSYKPEFFLISKPEDFGAYHEMDKQREGYWNNLWPDLGPSSRWRGVDNSYANSGFSQFLQDSLSITPFKYHLHFNSPIIWVTLARRTKVDSQGVWRYQVDFHKDQILKDIAFQKIKDAFTVYQEIDSFLSGVLGSEQKPLIEIPDKYRLEGHGFDKKTSFRKSKS